MFSFTLFPFLSLPSSPLFIHLLVCRSVVFMRCQEIDRYMNFSIEIELHDSRLHEHYHCIFIAVNFLFTVMCVLPCQNSLNFYGYNRTDQSETLYHFIPIFKFFFINGNILLFFFFFASRNQYFCYCNLKIWSHC